MGEITFKTGHVTTQDKVRQFFEYLFEAEETGDQYPVDLDVVWPMAYANKANAKRALQEGEEYFVGVDYQVVSEVDATGTSGGGGMNKEKIYLTTSCFEFLIARKIRPVFEIYRLCRIEMTKAAKAKARLPYHLRRYLINHEQVPFGYFSVLQEVSTRLIASMEISGYTVPDRVVPDISVGMLWARYLREVKGIDTDKFDTYDHRYEDGRVVKAKLYPNEMLHEFISILQNNWIPEKAPEYFGKRDPAAVPHIPGQSQVGGEPKRIDSVQ